MRGFLIKLGIGVVGLLLLLYFGSIDLAVLGKAFHRPDFLLLAFLCLLATIPMGAWRWWMLLRGLQFRVAFTWAQNITFISLFFHTFLPGAQGGDLVRVAMAYRAAGGEFSRVMFSVVVDRLTGLTALLVLGLTTLPLLPSAYSHRLIWVAAIAVAAGAIGVFLGLRFSGTIVRLVGRLPAPVGPAAAAVIGEFAVALQAYAARPLIIVVAVLISIVQYGLVLAALMLLGNAMEFRGLSFSGYIIAGAWSLVANGLPITPGGIGVGEAAFGQVASALASPGSGTGFGTIFLAMRVLTIVLGVIAVVPWLMYRNDVRAGLTLVRSADRHEKQAVQGAK
ncbi:MAG: flippase-like domain-containing protein [Reyranella sp.]|uniref:lysylphosphatidylglycerol synthase transmembrane domain-containing protein n=1 Tax=Reyranella sp. TaxID=1929291 RepID=UPI001AD3B725|nr:lysylphosphatidylglycerol synthase transmembrane domain-containing protein [Reyranella sp.]MBN9089616.1 flippase-like domain-containing protein [Reyranella sp.]